ncbi:MAG: GMC family oxidoreductase N-terminal domain-containing protein [Polyangiales bacterium]
MQQEYDYIVVGAGSSGAVIAARLSENPNVRVALIEAGGPDKSTFVRKPGMIGLIHQIPQLKARFDWGYYTTPQTHMNDRKVPYTRGRVLGGCSAVNGMLYLRGNKANYDSWATSGCDGWSHEDVLPYFMKLEDHVDGANEHRGAGGPIPITKQPPESISPVSNAFMDATANVCRVPKLDDFNGPSQEGTSVFQMTAKDGVRFSSSEAYLRPNTQRPNLDVITGALVRRIVIKNGRVIGVQIDTQNEVRTISVTSDVVLSAGAVNSPQLLMLSGIGPADQLRQRGVDVVHDLPGVGQNLHDHLFVPVTFRAKTSKRRGSAPFFLMGMMREYLLPGTGWFGRTVFEAGAFVKSGATQPIPNIQMHSLPWGYPTPNQDGPKMPHVDSGNCFTIMPTLIYPKARGEITLRSSDPNDAPSIDPNYLARDEDLQLLVRAVELAREIAADSAMDGHIVKELYPGADRKSKKEIEDEVRLRATTVYHPVGTCKMGVDEMAVIDPKLRVRGIDGLRVADASIMPSITGGNTNAPCLMIGEKAAAMIVNA